jgi:hypothetical protein
MIRSIDEREMMMASTLFLRRVLALDSASCAGLGILLAAGGAPLAPLFGLSEELLRGAGMLLLPFAAFLAWLASRPAPSSPLVWLVIIGNIAWTAESFVLLAQQSERVTTLGGLFVSAQALAVLVLAGLEYAGLRRMRLAA